jgi:hypothetical protein
MTALMLPAAPGAAGAQEPALAERLDLEVLARTRAERLERSRVESLAGSTPTGGSSSSLSGRAATCAAQWR